MLDAGQQRGGVGKVFALIAAGHGRGDCAAKEGILPCALGNAAPAGFHGDVAHGREGPVEAGGRSFARGYAGRLLDGLRVPGRRKAEVDGEYGPEAVDYVVAEEQGDAQPGFVDGYFLHLAGVIRSVGIEDVAAAAGADVVDVALAHRGAGDGPVAREQDQLADFLVEGHALHELVHAGIVQAAGLLRARARGKNNGCND